MTCQDERSTVSGELLWAYRVCTRAEDDDGTYDRYVPTVVGSPGGGWVRCCCEGIIAMCDFYYGGRLTRQMLLCPLPVWYNMYVLVLEYKYLYNIIIL